MVTRATLITVSVAAAVSVRPRGFAVVVSSYAGLSIAYSLRLEREPVV